MNTTATIETNPAPETAPATESAAPVRTNRLFALKMLLVITTLATSWFVVRDVSEARKIARILDEMSRQYSHGIQYQANRDAAPQTFSLKRGVQS
jgi:hypothetical protein